MLDGKAAVCDRLCRGHRYRRDSGEQLVGQDGWTLSRRLAGSKRLNQVGRSSWRKRGGVRQ